MEKVNPGACSDIPKTNRQNPPKPNQPTKQQQQNHNSLVTIGIDHYTNSLLWKLLIKQKELHVYVYFYLASPENM